MKNFLLFVAILLAGNTFAQNELPEKTNDSVTEEKGVLKKYTWFHNNGNVKETGYFLNGQKHGLWTSYDESGNKIMEAEYSLGTKTGNWLVWRANGAMQYLMVYENGKRILVTEWDSNGNVIAGNQMK